MSEQCTWATCDAPATTKHIEWWLCDEHLRISENLAFGDAKAEARRQLAKIPGKNKRQIATCPSYTAQQRHKRRGETCEICSSVIAVRQRVAACGTMAGYRKHLREKTTPCEPCRAATRLKINPKKKESAPVSTPPPPSPQEVATKPVKPTKPLYEKPENYVRPRGQHCGHCSQSKACRDYHIWDCKECVAEKAASAVA